MLCRHYRILGRVQGVFFRGSTRDVARQLSLKGWVRNMPDGSVEAVACGSDEHLSQFEIWLRQGPPMALVEKVESHLLAEVPQTDEFEIRYS